MTKTKPKPQTLQDLVDLDMKKKKPWWKRTLARKVVKKSPYLNTGIEG